MKRLKSILATVMVLTIIFGMEVLAKSVTDSYYLPKNSSCQVVANKSTNLDYFGFRLIDVYPTGNKTDTYKRIKLSAVDKNGYTVISTKVITESSTITTIPALQDLDTADYVLINLKGNDTTLDAWADIYLNWY